MTLRNQQQRNIERNHGTLRDNSSKRIYWRKQKSYGVGVPEFGIENPIQFNTYAVDVIMDTPSLQQIDDAGGSILAGDFFIQMKQKPGDNDEFQYDGAIYQIVSDATITKFGNATWYSFVIRRASE